MSQRPRVFVFRQGSDALASLIHELEQHSALTVFDSLEEGLIRIQQESPDAICVTGSSLCRAGMLLETGGLLALLPDGLLILNAEGSILWGNERSAILLLGQPAAQELNGQNFFKILGTESQMIGPDFSPLNLALASGDRSRTIIRRGDKQYLEATFTPVSEPATDIPNLVLVVLRDTSSETLQQQKLNAIIQAGIDLGDLQPNDVVDLSLVERVDLLKSKLLHYIQDLLEFNTVEIRIKEQSTGRLQPLLAVGMKPSAAERELFALAERNGVTGFVAATGRSYLCVDTSKDPLYIEGAEGAKSSLTVPLILHEQVLGTFNVESPRIGAFSERDLQYLELFGREVAIALNTLNLLVVEKATTLAENANRVLCDVAVPVNEILRDASWILEKLENDPAVCEYIRRILGHTQDIRQRIFKTGESLPAGQGQGIVPAQSSVLRSRRILVADADSKTHRDALELLGRRGCIIETAQNGEEALRMTRTFHYDVVLADIRLPDITGSKIYFGLKAIRPEMPVILMTGFDYDGDHAIPKAREAGMKRALSKPFKARLLIAALEEVLAVRDT